MSALPEVVKVQLVDGEKTADAASPTKACNNTVLWVALLVITIMYLIYRTDITVQVNRIEGWLNKKQCAKDPFGCNNGIPVVPIGPYQ